MALISTAAAVMFASPAVVHAQQVSRTYNVPSQGLDAALKAIVAASGEQVIYEPGSVKGKRSRAVVGSYSTDQAVVAALRGTGLSVSRSARGVLVVTNSAVPAQSPRGEGEAGSAAAEIGDAVPLDQAAQEIVVTGSHIRGSAPAGANLMVLGREELDSTGRGSLAEAIQTMPQVHGGGANRAVTRTGIGAAPNNFGSIAGNYGSESLNLRGLGVDETLTLVNGRRLAPAGASGAIADISMLPIVAVERIEILADGASATYGADAMAGVINIITNRRFEGAETRLRTGLETRSGQPEFGLAQTVGWAFDRGSVLFSADYLRQDAITAKARPFAASADLRPLGGGDHRYFFCSPGNIFEPFELAGAIPAGQDGLALTPAQVRQGDLNLCDIYSPQSNLTPRVERVSLYLSGAYELTEKLHISTDIIGAKRSAKFISTFPVSYMRVPASNAYRQINGFHGNESPLDQDMYIAYSFTAAGPDRSSSNAWSLLASVDARYDLGSDWEVRLTGSYGLYDNKNTSPRLDERPAAEGGTLNLALESSDPSTAFNPFGYSAAEQAGLVSSFLYPYKEVQKSDYHSISMAVSGSLVDLPGGAVKLALGGDFRWETFGTRTNEFYSNLAPSFYQSYFFDASRDVAAAFGELYVPIFSESNAVAGARRLSVSLSGRYDHYSDFGRTFNPKIGLTWMPIEGLTLRSSYGTSFKAPFLRSLYGQTEVLFPNLLVPQAPDPNGDGSTKAMFVFGGNLNLKPEAGKSWTIGADIEPKAFPGMRLRATYFNLRFSDRFADASYWPIIFSDQSAYEGIAYFPLPPQSQVDQLLAMAHQVSGEVPPPGSIEAIIDMRTMNFASQIVDGIDAAMSYQWRALGGTFNLSGNVTYLSRYNSRLGDSVSVTSYVGNVGLPTRWKGRAGLTWADNSVSVSGWINHVASYTNKTVLPHKSVSGNSTIDLSVTAQLGSAIGQAIGSGLALSLYVTNLFDKAPPFVDNSIGVGYDGANADPTGRRIALQLTKRW